jgi:hypothetical protein
VAFLLLHRPRASRRFSSTNSVADYPPPPPSTSGPRWRPRRVGGGGGGGSGAERVSGLHRRLRRGRGVGVVEGTNEEEAAAPMGIQCQLEMAIFDSPQLSSRRPISQKGLRFGYSRLEIALVPNHVRCEPPNRDDQRQKILNPLMGSWDQITAATLVRGTLTAFSTPASTVDARNRTPVPPSTPSWNVTKAARLMRTVTASPPIAYGGLRQRLRRPPARWPTQHTTYMKLSCLLGWTK